MSDFYPARFVKIFLNLHEFILIEGGYNYEVYSKNGIDIYMHISEDSITDSELRIYLERGELNYEAFLKYYEYFKNRPESFE